MTRLNAHEALQGTPLGAYLAAVQTPEHGKRTGIRHSAEAADRLDEGWKERAYAAVLQCAAVHPEFICDTVWDFLPAADRPPQWHKPKALGGVMQRAARAGVIRRTDRSRISENATRHRSPVPIWQSLTKAHSERSDAA